MGQPPLPCFSANIPGGLISLWLMQIVIHFICITAWKQKSKTNRKLWEKKKKEPKLSHKGTECLVEFVKTDLLIPLSSVLLRCQHGGGILF